MRVITALGLAIAAGCFLGCSATNQPSPGGNNNNAGSGGGAATGGSGPSGAGATGGAGGAGPATGLLHGSPCTADTACRSGVCTNTGTCAGNGTGAPSGSPCDVATECASNSCTAAACAAGTNLTDGASCSTAAECGSGACTDGVCGSTGVVPGTGGSSGAGGGGPSGGTGGADPSGGTGGSSGGSGGDQGVSGSAGTGGGGPLGPFDVPRGKSAGCGMQNADEPGTFVRHDLDIPLLDPVTGLGVDPAFIAENPPQPNAGGYTYTFRNYFIRLPNGYDPSVAYPLVFGGGGCGSTDGRSGNGGGANPLSGAAEDQAIQIGLSYVWSGGACFEDGHSNTPDVPYFDTVYADVISKNCVDLEKVFISGYSSGAWLSYTVSLARGGIIRGMAAGAGGLRENRPTPSDIPFAMLGITGMQDGGNPIHDVDDGVPCNGTEEEGCWMGQTICGFPGAEDCVDEGSGAARDHILLRNGCTGREFEQWGEWPECKKYTGCPAAFPVIYCTPEGGHTDGGERFNPGGWDFWMSLPPVP